MLQINYIKAEIAPQKARFLKSAYIIIGIFCSGAFSAVVSAAVRLQIITLIICLFCFYVTVKGIVICRYYTMRPVFLQSGFSYFVNFQSFFIFHFMEIRRQKRRAIRFHAGRGCVFCGFPAFFAGMRRCGSSLSFFAGMVTCQFSFPAVFPVVFPAESLLPPTITLLHFLYNFCGVFGPFPGLRSPAGRLFHPMPAPDPLCALPNGQLHGAAGKRNRTAPAALKRQEKNDLLRRGADGSLRRPRPVSGGKAAASPMRFYRPCRNFSSRAGRFVSAGAASAAASPPFPFFPYFRRFQAPPWQKESPVSVISFRIRYETSGGFPRRPVKKRPRTGAAGTDGYKSFPAKQNPPESHSLPLRRADFPRRSVSLRYGIFRLPFYGSVPA